MLTTSSLCEHFQKFFFWFRTWNCDCWVVCYNNGCRCRWTTSHVGFEASWKYSQGDSEKGDSYDNKVNALSDYNLKKKEAKPVIPQVLYLMLKPIDNLMKDRTVFIIAHRLSTIKNTDRIAVINEGELVELRTHDELMLIENGQYKALYEMQFKKQEVNV